MFSLPSCIKVRFLPGKSNTGFFCHTKVLFQDGRWMLHPQNYPRINSTSVCQPLVQSCSHTPEPSNPRSSESYSLIKWLEASYRATQFSPKDILLLFQVILFGPHSLHLLLKWCYMTDIIEKSFSSFLQISYKCISFPCYINTCFATWRKGLAWTTCT